MDTRDKNKVIKTLECLYIIYTLIYVFFAFTLFVGNKIAYLSMLHNFLNKYLSSSLFIFAITSILFIPFLIMILSGIRKNADSLDSLEIDVRKSQSVEKLIQSDCLMYEKKLKEVQLINKEREKIEKNLISYTVYFHRQINNNISCLHLLNENIISITKTHPKLNKNRDLIKISQNYWKSLEQFQEVLL